MPLTLEPLAEAVPGKPLTAQAWNALTSAITDLYDAINDLDLGSTARISVENEKGEAIRHARVVAQREKDAVEAVPPFANKDIYVLGGLEDGDWNLVIEAEGYESSEKSISIPAGNISITLESDGSIVMPDLYGMSAKEAYNEVTSSGLGWDRIFDTAGIELTQTDLTKKRADDIVLIQQPTAGTHLTKGSKKVRMVLGAQISQQEMVTVPDFSGKTLDQIQAKAAELGLEIGTVGYLK